MLANGVKETTTTTGTGTVTLSAVTGYPRVADIVPTGAPVDYAIRSGSNWEWGVGKAAAGNTLERTTVTAKYESGTYAQNPGTKLTLSGTSDVFATLHAGSVERAPMAHLRVRTNVVKQIFSGHAFETSKVTMTPAASYCYLFPFKLDLTATISKIGMQPSNSVAGATCRVALYEVGPDGLPSRLACESGQLTCDTANTVYLTTLGAAVELQAGWYWAALNMGGTACQVHALNVGNAPRPLFGVNSSGVNSGVGVYYMPRSIAAFPADAASFPLTSFSSDLIGNFPQWPAIILEV